MKIKQTFVTNSSTVCFIVSGNDDLSEQLKEYNDRENYIPTCISLKSIGQLNYYTKNGNFVNEHDSWIDSITGPCDYFYLDKEDYNLCKEVIDDNKYVSIVKIDNCADINSLSKFIEKNNNEIIMVDDL